MVSRLQVGMCYMFMSWGGYNEGRALLEGLMLVMSFAVMGQGWEVFYSEISVQVWVVFDVMCL